MAYHSYHIDEVFEVQTSIEIFFFVNSAINICSCGQYMFTNVTILICQVKHWAKAHEVNSALHRTLNSVSITLLVALHLQV